VPLIAIYAHTATAVAFIISELPGERAEALLFSNGSVGAHGGRAIQTLILNWWAHLADCAPLLVSSGGTQ
jgi:hypothetical protein